MRILFVAASPDSEARLRLDKEYNAIKQRLNEVRDPTVELDLHAEWAVQPQHLSAALLDYDPHIVHFAGHGERDGVFFEDAQGNAVQVPSAALAETFELIGKSVQCVVLNACHSAEHSAAIARAVGAVVGTRREISDTAALAFAAGFYRALSRGLSVEEAFRLGKNEIHLLNLGEQTAPQLLILPEAVRQAAPAAPATPAPPPLPADESAPLHVYVSKPSAMTAAQERLWSEIRSVLDDNGVTYRCMGDTDHPRHSPLVDVANVMRECHGAMALGFSQFATEFAVAKEGTERRSELRDVHLATPWNHIEAAIGHALGLPLFLIREDKVREEGILDRGSLPLFIHATDLSEGWATRPEFQVPLKTWLGEVQHFAKQRAT